jgi:Domain of unknown function (DUF4349)
MVGRGGSRTVAAAGAVLLAALLGLSGCSQAGGDSSSSKGMGVAAGGAVAPRNAAAGADSGTSSTGSTSGTSSTSGTGSGTAATQPTGRSLIYTGEMQLSAPEVDPAVTRAEQLTTAAGGYVDAEQSGPVGELSLTSYPTGGSSGDASTGGADSSLPLQNLPEPGDVGAQAAQLVLRIPAARYTAVFQQLLGLGADLGQERTSQDVTSQVVDVASRISSQQASVARVRALMDQAQSLSDVISLEAALTQRESALESLEAEQRSLQSQTAMSTVTVQVFEKPTPRTAAPVHRPKPKKGVGAAAQDALADGWHGLYLTFRVLLVVLSALLPFAVVLVPLGWLALWLTRRRSHPATAATATAATAGPAVPTEPEDGADE